MKTDHIDCPTKKKKKPQDENLDTENARRKHRQFQGIGGGKNFLNNFHLLSN